MTTRDLLESALALPASERLKLAAELFASLRPGESVSGASWDDAWLREVGRREAAEPNETLGPEKELPAVRQRLLGLFP